MAFAILTAASPDVKTKPTRLPSSDTRILGSGKQVSDMRPGSDISSGVRARGTAYRRLVYVNDPVDIFQAQNGLIGAFFISGVIKPIGQGFIEYIVNQSTFTGAGHARHCHESAERYVHINIFKIVLGNASKLYEVTGNFDRPSFGRHGNFLFA